MITINSEHLDIKTIESLMTQAQPIKLAAKSRKKVVRCRKYLDDKLAKSDALFYGINTGFGSLCNIKISNKEIQNLQHNLVMSHAAGTGEEVPEEIVKLMLLLKIQGLAFGHSAINDKTLDRLIQFYNNNITPVIFQQGSLGASGDLAPLAHLSLALIGLGNVRHEGKVKKTATVLKKFGWEPIQLLSKEGLALLNGTQFSSAYLTWSLIKAKALLKQANLNAAISIDAFDCRLSPFDEKLHKIRAHHGQVTTAKLIKQWLKGSKIASKQKGSVQDPYAFRCVPQVHGASQDTFDYIEKVLQTEINSVTDNPTIFPDQDEILSGGNFHAQPLALTLDFLAIACAELGSISERRLYQLISGQRGLPPFLTPNAGLHSGLMIAQYTAASVVSQNKQLCTPASVDSIVSCNGQEDHVSMAANAGTKAFKVVQNLETLLSIEFLAAAQGLHLRRPLKSSPKIEKIIAQFRKQVKPLVNDRIISEDIAKTKSFLQTLNIN